VVTVDVKVEANVEQDFHTLRYVIHLDWDYPIPEEWVMVWKEQKTFMLRNMGFEVERIIIKNPKDESKETAETVYKGRKAVHIWVHILSLRQLSEDELNMLQWLCCDDVVRVFINRMRTERGLKVYWNKLFTRHVWVKPMDENCKRCKIRRVISEAKKEAAKHVKN
jgi:hypothetical protein